MHVCCARERDARQCVIADPLEMKHRKCAEKAVRCNIFYDYFQFLFAHMA